MSLGTSQLKLTVEWLAVLSLCEQQIGHKTWPFQRRKLVHAPSAGEC